MITVLRWNIKGTQCNEGLLKSKKTIQIADSTGNPFNISYTYYMHALVRQQRDEPEAALEWSEKALTISEDYNLPHNRAWSKILKGWATGVLGARKGMNEIIGLGIKLIKDGIKEENRIGSIISRQIHFALIADVYIRSENIQKAKMLIKEGLLLISKRGEAWGKEELLSLSKKIRTKSSV